MDGDTKAAPQAAGGTHSEDVEQGLHLLRVVYQEWFTFGYDREVGRFWVMKDDCISTALTAGAPVELGKLIRDTWGGAR